MTEDWAGLGRLAFDQFEACPLGSGKVPKFWKLRSLIEISDLRSQIGFSFNLPILKNPDLRSENPQSLQRTADSFLEVRPVISTKRELLSILQHHVILPVKPGLQLFNLIDAHDTRTVNP